MQQAEDGRSIKSLLQDLKVQRFDHMNGVESCREKESLECRTIKTCVWRCDRNRSRFVGRKKTENKTAMRR
ncbi:hypothetical protein DM860_015643 [Cuscuta australis]|uniref:Uncharacterized protein n=1 Tax=Cuscuta australis TaxID=267555 RepID=A0A328DJL2_9ASTE|nr:hypothetical protein DM860_015643 [Cuscuta australis]